MLIGVAADASRDNQVDHSCHLLPLSLLVLLVLLLQCLNQHANQVANVFLKVA